LIFLAVARVRGIFFIIFEPFSKWFIAIFEGMAFFLLENWQVMAIFLDNPAGPGH